MTDFWQSSLSSLTTALLGAVVTTLVAGIAAYCGSFVPKVKEKLRDEKFPLVAAFFMSLIVSTMMGLALRHLTWEEMHSLKEEMHSLNVGFSIIAGGKIDRAGKDLSDAVVGPFAFRVDQPGPSGQYKVAFTGGKTLPVDSIIMVGSLGDVAEVSASLVRAGPDSFRVQTSVNNSAAAAGFWFLVMHRGSPPW
jgi:hypothetical protein